MDEETTGGLDGWRDWRLGGILVVVVIVEGLLLSPEGSARRALAVGLLFVPLIIALCAAPAAFWFARRGGHPWAGLAAVALVGVIGYSTSNSWIVNYGMDLSWLAQHHGVSCAAKAWIGHRGVMDSIARFGDPSDLESFAFRTCR